MLEAAGLELPKEGWTWDDLKTYAKALRNVDKGEYGFAICGSSSDAGTEWQFWPFLLQNGGKIIENGKAVFNSPAGVEALEFICSLIKEDLIPAGVASMDLNQMTDMQVANKLAMWHDGPWMLGSLQLANPDANIVAVPMTKNVMGGNICGGTAIAISSISPNKEAAWKFIFSH